MPINPQSIMEVRLGYIANDQLCYNVWHLYVVAGVGENDSEIGWEERVRDYYAGGINTNGELLKEFRDLMSNEVEIHDIATQFIYPLRYRSAKTIFSAANFGLVASNCTAQNVAAVFAKFGELGARNNVGSMHIGGLPENGYLAGELTAGSFAQVEAIADVWDNNLSFTVGGATTTFGPGILQKEPIEGSDPVRYQISGIAPVVATQANPYVRTMRRRTVRVGI